MSKKKPPVAEEIYDEYYNEVESEVESEENDVDTDPQKRRRNKRPPRESKYKGMGKRITVPIIKLSAGDTWA